MKTYTKILSLILSVALVITSFACIPIKANAATISPERQAVINYMMDMATVKWTAGKTFKTLKYYDTAQKKNVYRTWNSGYTYYGIPYSQNTSITNSVSNTIYIAFGTFETILKNNSGKISQDLGRNDCSYAVCKAFSKADSKVSISNTRSMKPGTNSLIAVGSYTFKTDKATTCNYNGKEKMFEAYSCLQPGDAVVRDGHTMLISEVNTNKKIVKVIHQSGSYKYYDKSTNTTKQSDLSNGNTSWGINETVSFSSLFSQGYIPITCQGLKNSSQSSYQITSAKCEGVTNNSATIKVSLDKSATVKKWTYFLSTDKSLVSKVDGTDGATHKKTDKMDCVRILDYTSNPQKQSTATFTINKLFSSKLSAGTTYYYKATVYIGNKWYESSVGQFTTSKNKPGTPNIRVASNSINIGIGDQATVLWDQVTEAESYTITLKNSSGTTVQTKSNVTGTTCVLDGIKSAGNYTVNIAAVNSAGSTGGNSKTITVHPDVTVKFYDTISKTVIATTKVHYGHAATAPKNPQREGHAFSKWDKAFDKVTVDITVNTVYDVNSYTVRFIDSFTNQELSKQQVKYNSSAVPPSVKAPEGYSLAGWDKSCTSIKSDMTIYTVYKWTDKNYTATATINSVKRSTTKEGYDVSVTVKNHIDEISSGRIVAALRSAKGLLLTEIESAAFALEGSESRTFTITVLYPELAPKVEVYVINAYDSLGQLAKPVGFEIDNSTSTAWSQWITYTGTCPMSTGNGVTVETRTLTSTTPTRHYYCYQIMETTTSYNTWISGWSQNGYSLQKSSSGSVSYVASWPSGFSTSNSLYTKYNVSPKSASESATEKVVIDSTSTAGYIYWHWCRGDNAGAINRKINWSKTSTYDTFHAFESTTKKSYDSSANAYKWQNTSVCKDTHWWNGMKSGSDGLVTIKKQNYTVYKKLYNYYRYSDWSGWIEYSGNVPVSNGASAGTNKEYRNVTTKTEPGTTTYTYQYRYMTTNNPTIEEPSVSSNRLVDIKANVDSKHAGERAIVWVYKYDQASDYTIEYTDCPLVASDGSINLAQTARLREAPTVESGDYTIVVSLPGESKAIEIGKIEAPKPTYTVEFYDFDKTTVISTQTVTEGGSATYPTEDKLTVPEGNRFTKWSESVVNVRNNMKVFPESETKTYVVAFVNWEVQSVELKEFTHGSELIADGVPEGKEGFVTEWVVQVDNNYVTINEFTTSGKTVTGNMVVETKSTPEKYEVTIIDADKNQLIDEEKLFIEGSDSYEIADEYVVSNGEYIDFGNVQMEIEENPEYIFVGWINAHTGEAIIETEVHEDLLIYPSYFFAETTEVPEADVKTGEYSTPQTVTLSCATEHATIWYTVDGSDPKSSSTAKEYTEAFTVSTSCMVRYYAGSVGKNDSEETVSVYAINSGSGTKYHVITVWTNIFDGASFEPAIGLVKHGSLLPTSLFTSVEGYTFDTLYYDEDFVEEYYYESEAVTESLDLYAKYMLEIKTVKFVDYDGTVLDTQKVEYYSSATMPASPVREGYVFTGWDKETDCVVEDMTVTAMYIPESENATVKLSRTRPLTLMKGYSAQLKATIVTESELVYEVVWSSEDESVATVDQTGRITGVSVGSTVISAQLPYTGSKATLNVTVTENLDYSIILNSSSVMGFDSNHNLRGVPIGQNTVGELKEHFANADLVFVDKTGNVLTDDDAVGTGTIINLLDGESVLDSTIVVLTGDMNCDGFVNNRDAAMITRYLVDKEVADDYQMIAMDVNGDGYVNNRDAAMISRYLVGKEVI